MAHFSPYENMTIEEMIESMRDDFLSAMDQSAKMHLNNLPEGQEGALDADLPLLLPTLDAHFKRLIERAKVATAAKE